MAKSAVQKILEIPNSNVEALIGYPGQETWIGLKQRAGWDFDNKWNYQWVDGPDQSHTTGCLGWNVPNSFTSENNDNAQLCVRIRWANRKQWTDHYCSQQYARICEYVNKSVPTVGDTSSCAQSLDEFCTVPAKANASQDLTPGMRVDKGNPMQMTCDDGFAADGPLPSVCADDGTGSFGFHTNCVAIPMTPAEAAAEKFVCRVYGDRYENYAERVAVGNLSLALSAKAVVTSLVKGAKMTALLDAMSAEEQVGRLVDALNDRPPSAAEVASLGPRIDAGERLAIIDELLASPEYAERNGVDAIPGDGRSGCVGGQSPLLIEGRRKLLVGGTALPWAEAVAFCAQRGMRLIGDELIDKDQRTIVREALRAFRPGGNWADAEEREVFWTEARFVNNADPSMGYQSRSHSRVMDFVETFWAPGEPADDDCTAGGGSCPGVSNGIVWDAPLGLFRDVAKGQSHHTPAYPACTTIAEVTPVEEETGLADPSEACLARGGLQVGFRCLEAQPLAASWPAAQSLCRQLGGRLPAPTSSHSLHKLHARMGADGQGSGWLAHRFANTMAAGKVGQEAELLRRASVAEGASLPRPPMDAPAEADVGLNGLTGFLPPTNFVDGMDKDCLLYEHASGSASNVFCYDEAHFYCEFAKREVGSMRFEQTSLGEWSTSTLTSAFPATLTGCTEECLKKVYKERKTCVSVAFDVVGETCALGTLKAADSTDAQPASPTLFVFDALDAQ